MNTNVIKFKDLDENIKEYFQGIKTSFSDEYRCDKYAPCNIPFNKLLYMKRGNKLMAVKFIIASYFNSFDNDKLKHLDSRNGFWCYLIQTPYGVEWTNNLHSVRFFHSKEEYFQHLENGNGGFEIKMEMVGHLIGIPPMKSVFFKKTWKWNGHCAERTQSCITNMVINENGLNIILSNYKGEYWSKEDCIKANINGMKIVDFPETENSIKVSIEVVKTPPIVRTITFVEG